jgi:glycosyltransferase involved in cell wall biosynthesis
MVQGYFAGEKARQYHLPRRPMLAVERWGTRSHRHLIAVSDDLARRLQAVAPAATVSVIANGVDHAAIATALATAPQRPSAHRAELVFLGRLELDQKGLDLLLGSFAEIVRRRPMTRLTIAGSGKDRHRVIELIADLGLEPNVDLVGRVSGARKWRTLSGAAVVVVPSRYETFGLTALEAMACGTPVVAFDIDCLRDIVTRGDGVLVEPFDTGAYADAVLRLLADPVQRRRRGEHGRACAAAYDWDALCVAQEAVYERARADVWHAR